MNNTQDTAIIRKEDFIYHDEKYWLKKTDLANKLGFKHIRSIDKLFKNYRDELSHHKGYIESTTPGGKQESVHYDMQGCFKLAMFARTEQAKQFRIVVSKFLEDLSTGEFQEQFKRKLAEMELEKLIAAKWAADWKHEAIYQGNRLKFHKQKGLPISKAETAMKAMGKGLNLFDALEIVELESDSFFSPIPDILDNAYDDEQEALEERAKYQKQIEKMAKEFGISDYEVSKLDDKYSSYRSTHLRLSA